MIPITRPILSISCLIAWASPMLFAQSVDTPIFDQHLMGIKQNHDEIIQKALAVRKKVAAINNEEIARQLLDPKPETIQLPKVLTKELTTEQIAEHARKFNLRVGYCYKCTSCDHWHVNLAGGYAIAPNVIVTCEHVLASKLKIREGFLVVADQDDNVACGVAVLARSAVMDAAIVKVDGANFQPVPLNFNVKQGSDTYCISYPLKQQGYFSTGIINRFYWRNTYKGEDKTSIDGLSHLRVNYSNDWAPGSSGSPLFDSEGNVTGHVSTISSLAGGKTGQSNYLLLHEGIPAKAVKKLAETMNNAEEIKRIANVQADESKKPEPKAADPKTANQKVPDDKDLETDADDKNKEPFEE